MKARRASLDGLRPVLSRRQPRPPLRPADDDHGVIVVGLACECAASDDHVLRERLRRELAAVRQSLVEPLVAVLVAVAARLDEAVREEAERGSGLERRASRLVRLVRLDAEREAARREEADRAVGGQDADRRMPGARGRSTAPVAGSTVTQAIVTKFPPASSPNATSFACARSAAGSGYRRTSERNANFASAMSAVAAIPCPLASPSTTASSPSGSVRKS